MVPFADSLSWTTVGIAVAGAALVAIAGLLLAVVLVRRRTPAERRLERMVQESTARVEEMIAGLAGSLDRSQTEAALSRHLVEIASTIDLDLVVQRVLEAAKALPGVDAALLRVDDARAPIAGSVGLTASELPTGFDPGSLGTGDVRAAVSTYLYPPSSESAYPVRGSVSVPISEEEEGVIGALWAFWRSPDDGGAADRLATLEDIARRAGPALVNARRFKEARELADLDPLTGLHNHRYFHETLRRESARAHRYERELALIVFDIDDFKAINDRIGHLGGDTVLSEVAQCLKSVVRSADIACRIGGDELAVILPESGRQDAAALFQRIEDRLDGWPGTTEPLRLSAGIAALRAEDDAPTLFKRADRALYRAKHLGKGQAIADEGDRAD